MESDNKFNQKSLDSETRLKVLLVKTKLLQGMARDRDIPQIVDYLNEVSSLAESLIITMGLQEKLLQLKEDNSLETSTDITDLLEKILGKPTFH